MTLSDQQIYISTSCFEPSLSIEEVIKLCFDIGIKQIEFGGTTSFTSKLDEVLAKYNGLWLAHNYFPIPKDNFVLNFASSNTNIIKRSFDQMKNSIEFCKRYKIPHFSIHPGFLADPEVPNNSNRSFQKDFEFKNNLQTREKASNIALKNFEKLVKLFSDSNIKLIFEIQGSIEKNHLLLYNSPEEFEKLIKIFGRNNVGILCDFGHLALASIANNFSKVDFVKEFWDSILEFHVNDNNGKFDEHLPVNNNSWFLNVFNEFPKEEKVVVLEYRAYKSDALKTIVKSSCKILKECF